jgi:hypothetical protein
MIAAVDCINEDCPSDTADPEPIYEDGNVIVGLIYTCKICNTTWLEMTTNEREC